MQGGTPELAPPAPQNSGGGWMHGPHLREVMVMVKEESQDAAVSQRCNCEEGERLGTVWRCPLAAVAARRRWRRRQAGAPAPTCWWLLACCQRPPRHCRTDDVQQHSRVLAAIEGEGRADGAGAKGQAAGCGRELRNATRDTQDLDESFDSPIKIQCAIHTLQSGLTCPPQTIFSVKAF